MKAYSLDLRQRIIEAYQNSEGSQRDLAKRFKVSLNFIQKLVKQYRESADITPRPRGKGFPCKLAQHTETLERLLEEKNDATLEELRISLEQETGVQVSISNICRFLQKHKLTRKKNSKSDSSWNTKSSKSKI